MKITYTQVKSFLNKCVFNPRLPGPLKIISEINNPDYYEQRAMEFIREAQDLELRVYGNLETYDNYIIKAVQLLTLARETRYEKFRESDKKEFDSINES